MEKIGVILGLLGVLILILYIVLPGKNKTQKPKSFDESTFLGRIRTLFYSNEALDSFECYEKIGVPKSVLDETSIDLIEEYLRQQGLDQKTIDLIDDYATTILMRKINSTSSIYTIDPHKYNLIPKENEIVYKRIHNVTLLAEKTVRSTIQYSGSRISTGMLRMGSLTYTSNISKDFVPQDIGMLFLSDKRIIFVGHQKNISKSFNISNLLSVKPFKDGILLMFSNRSPILLQFQIGEQKGQNGTYIEDGLNVFVIVLSRIIEGTANIDIKTNVANQS